MQSTFDRYELKYRITQQQKTELIEALLFRMHPDAHEERAMHSLYFDTPNHLLARRALEKPVYKEKLRLRSYGPIARDKPVFVELKKKYRKVTFKRRVRMLACEAERYLLDGDPPPVPSQITREIDAFLALYPGLAPSFLITYDRCAFYGNEDGRLRVTFDENIRYQSCPDGVLAERAGGRRLIRPDECILELKVPDAIPLWLVQLLNQKKLYRSSFSKFTSAYRASLQGSPSELPQRAQQAAQILLDRKKVSYAK